MSLIKSLRALSPTSKCFLDKEKLQPLCFSVNSTNKRTTVKSIVSSKLPDVLLNENTRMNLDQFLKWFWKYKVTFPTIFAAERGFHCGSFDSHMRSKLLWCGEDTHTLSHRCMTHDRKRQLVSLRFLKNEAKT